MSKRFIDTEIWDDEWFQELPGKYQRLWFYVFSKCDCAGFWKVNFPLAGFQLKESFESSEALKLFNQGKERIKKISEGKWFITGFIKFQVTTLRRLDSNGKINRVHAPIYASLESNGISPLVYEIEDIEGSTEALQSLLNKTIQEKETKGIVKGKPSLEEAKALFREKGFPAEAEKFFDYYESNGWRVGKNPMKNWRAAVANWLRNGKSFGGGVAVKEKREPKPSRDCDACKGSGKLPDGKKCWCWV